MSTVNDLDVARRAPQRGLEQLREGHDTAAALDFTQAREIDASFLSRVAVLLSRRNGFR